LGIGISAFRKYDVFRRYRKDNEWCGADRNYAPDQVVMHSRFQTLNARHIKPMPGGNNRI
jgi:hypothetical protein